MKKEKSLYITIDTIIIKWIEQLYANKFESLDKKETFLLKNTY